MTAKYSLLKMDKSNSTNKQKCNRCGHGWNYKGKSEWYTSCPRCKTSIKVRKEEDSFNTSYTKEEGE